jgi:hypothetical protein
MKWFGLLRVRSPLLAESSLFLGLLRCFSSTTCLPCGSLAGGFPIRTSPAVCGCTRLTGAFRRVPRPSSAPDAKASTARLRSLPLRCCGEVDAGTPCSSLRCFLYCCLLRLLTCTSGASPPTTKAHRCVSLVEWSPSVVLSTHYFVLSTCLRDKNSPALCRAAQLPAPLLAGFAVMSPKPPCNLSVLFVFRFVCVCSVTTLCILVKPSSTPEGGCALTTGA